MGQAKIELIEKIMKGVNKVLDQRIDMLREISGHTMGTDVRKESETIGVSKGISISMIEILNVIIEDEPRLKDSVSNVIEIISRNEGTGLSNPIFKNK